MASKVKKYYLIGFTMIFASFVCIVVVFYFMQKANMDSLTEIDVLKEQITVLEIEKSNTEDNLEDVKGKLNTVELNHLLNLADKVYPSEEKNRKEGFMWVDKQTALYVVTLGALNGLEPGSRLVVYDGDRKVGRVVVDTPMDVISYVTPLSKSIQRPREDYYRVVIE